MLSSSVLLASACILACIGNIIGFYTYLSEPVLPHIEQRPEQRSYANDHYPLYIIPNDMLRSVALDIEESVHYGLGPVAFSDWETFATDQLVFNIGPKFRLYVSAFAHIHHCLLRFHRALYPDLHSEKLLPGHAQHCLNYIRQMMLCYPDLNLEPADALSRNWEIDRRGSTHICRDWSAVERASTELKKNWLRFRNDTFRVLP